MHRIYTGQSLIVPTRAPDTIKGISFIAASDGKYEFDKGRLYRRVIVPDDTEASAFINGVRFVKSATRWAKRKEVGRLPLVHAQVEGSRRTWTINTRLRLVEERIGKTVRAYLESTYDIDDPGFADLVKDYVQSPDK